MGSTKPAALSVGHRPAGHHPSPASTPGGPGRRGVEGKPLWGKNVVGIRTCGLGINYSRRCWRGSIRGGGTRASTRVRHPFLLLLLLLCYTPFVISDITGPRGG